MIARDFDAIRAAAFYDVLRRQRCRCRWRWTAGVLGALVLGLLCAALWAGCGEPCHLVEASSGGVAYQFCVNELTSPPSLVPVEACQQHTPPCEVH
jgi:hypothetical protein